jgi:broad specificity phosphatase PhoE
MIDFHKLRGKGELYFVRHGQAEGHDRGLMKGRADYPLTEEGRSQARATGAWFATHPVKLILSSPLIRASETAALIASSGGGPAPEPCPELIEIDTGIFTNQTKEERLKNHPAAWADFNLYSWDGVPGAESRRALYARAGRFWRKLSGIIAAGDTSIMAVSHMGIFQWLFRYTLGAARSWTPFLKVRECGIYRLIFEMTAERRYLAWDLMNLTVWPAGET